MLLDRFEETAYIPGVGGRAWLDKIAKIKAQVEREEREGVEQEKTVPEQQEKQPQVDIETPTEIQRRTTVIDLTTPDKDEDEKMKADYLTG